MIRWSVVCLTAAVASQASADGGKCSFGGTKLADDCSALGWQKAGDFYDGCCTGTGLVWCEEDGTALCGANCPDNDQVCGWNDGGYYWCGAEATPDPSGTLPLECATSCTAECSGKQCGFDGCSGFCGSCGENTYCTESGQCEACSCDGKSCGVDECGNSCGQCESGSFCSENQCEACSCNGKECGADECGKACGTCTGGQGCDTSGQCVDVAAQCIPKDEPGCSGCAEEECVCNEDDYCCDTEWDYICVNIWESCSEGAVCACVPQCDGQVCGSDGCGGTCGTCDAGNACVADGSKCLPCSCDGKTCGKNACGEECGTCDASDTCVDSVCKPAMCAPSAAVEDSPGCSGCSCEACVCEKDAYCCDTDWDSVCAGLCEECAPEECPCVPSCELKECGADGCGGSCGACDSGLVCNSIGVCCTPQCDGKSCGGDGCGGSCGTCESGFVCEKSQCVVCEAKCDGKTCGDDGCGGSCGTCESGKSCNEQTGTCAAPYPDSCLGEFVPSAETCDGGATFEGCCDANGRVVFCDGGQLFCVDCPTEGGQNSECGWNSAAGFYACGGIGADPTGAAPLACGGCTPECAGKECGNDGCGGTCGTCAGGLTCSPEGRCAAGGTDSTDATDGTDGTNATDGADGTNGTDGTNATDGTDGTNATDGTNGADGTNGTDGTNGATGTDGTKTDSSSSSGCSSTRKSGSPFLALGLVLGTLALIGRRRGVRASK